MRRGWWWWDSGRGEGGVEGEMVEKGRRRRRSMWRICGRAKSKPVPHCLVHYYIIHTTTIFSNTLPNTYVNGITHTVSW